MTLLKGVAAAFSTYSAIPMPHFDWDGEMPGRALAWFPAVGLVCGGALWGWYAACRALGLGELLFAALGTALPLLITGGIHMDGFMDTVDAVSSHQTRRRKLEILKDSHLGAFAAVYCGVYLVLSLGLLSELYRRDLVPAVCPGYVLSRGLSGVNALTLRNARGSGMLFASTSGHGRAGYVAALCAFSVLGCAGMLAASPAGCGGAVLGLLCVPAYRAFVRGQFGGATGDTAGFFLQVCELTVLLGTLARGLLL